MSIAVNRILDLMEGMTLVEFAELTNALKDRFDIRSSISISVKTESNDYNDNPVQIDPNNPVRPSQWNGNYCDVIFRSFGRQKINCIKLVREITGMGLKEAKEFTEGIGPDYPVLKRRIMRQEAEEIQDRFTEVNGIVDIV